MKGIEIAAYLITGTMLSTGAVALVNKYGHVKLAEERISSIAGGTTLLAVTWPAWTAYLAVVSTKHVVEMLTNPAEAFKEN